MRGLSATIVLAICYCLASLLPSATAFTEGEFIPAARKAQYFEVRTQWHDLLGQHCPRFGHNRVVAIPLPKPHAELEKGKDHYKIQLSFDGDRYVTPWLKIIGNGAPAVPVVEVLLTKAGDELVGVTAAVIAAPDVYLHVHHQLVEEFKNESHWPKHLLVRYHFKSEHEVDLDRGLYIIMIIGLSTLMVVAANAARGSRGKLAMFLREMVAEADTIPGISGVVVGGGAGGEAVPATWKPDAKGE